VRTIARNRPVPRGGIRPEGRPIAADPFAPTAYTAALLQQVRLRAARLVGAQVLELGTGSGLVLAAMLQAGARGGMGVDLEPAAVTATQDLLTALGLDRRAEVLQGDLWQPCAGRRFDVVVTNLPQYPLCGRLPEPRLPSWSDGGPDGRALVDRFLAGLPAHLAPGGCALMTHNRFIGIERTQALLSGAGLIAEVACTVCLPLSAARAQALPGPLRDAPDAPGLLRVGAQVFAEFDVLEICARGPAA
jgi:release factor glutamine methyltransferase